MLEEKRRLTVRKYNSPRFSDVVLPVEVPGPDLRRSPIPQKLQPDASFK